MVSNPILERMLSLQWSISCPRPRCNQNIMEKTREGDGIKIVCTKCGFQFPIPREWYYLSATGMLDQLMRFIHPLTEDGARSWINTVKYTHPSYQISQVAERDAARDEFREIVFLAVKGASGDKMGDGTRILTVGSNSCYELESVPVKFDEKTVLAVDASESSLRLGVARYPNVRFCCEFIEKLSANSLDLTGRKLGDMLLETFDLCLALRVFQASRLPLWAALTRIRDATHPGAKVIISVPRSTAIITEEGETNLRPGVFKGGKFDEEWPRQETDRIANEMTSGSYMYSNVTVYYGTKSSVEYYITAERNY